jgi:hypothetical protein
VNGINAFFTEPPELAEANAKNDRKKSYEKRQIVIQALKVVET